MTTADASYSQLFQKIVGDIQELVRSEFCLAKAEFREDMNGIKKVAVLIGAGALTSLFAVLFVLCSIVLALTLFIPAWAAALTVSVVVGIAGGLTIRAGLQRMKQVKLKPERTVHSIKEITQ